LCGSQKICQKSKNLEAGWSISKMNKKKGSKRQKLLTKSFIGLHNTDPHHLPQQGTTHTAPPELSNLHTQDD
jgi:hypothetical protein